MNTISIFKGNYSFLSNFFQLKTPILHNNIFYPTVEHFYQAMKSLSILERMIISDLPNAGTAKKYGRSVYLRSDWEEAKVSVMRFGLILKFAINHELKIQLLNTWESVLIEGNYWHDNVWGNCLCPKCVNIEGQNLLGRLLMEVRELFQLIK
jgi:ribA/ribD-fused uncharacterized protein